MRGFTRRDRRRHHQAVNSLEPCLKETHYEVRRRDLVLSACVELFDYQSSGPISTAQPDAADRFVWRLIFQGEPPSASPDPDKRRMRGVRIFGFLLFTLMGILFIAR